MRCTHTTCDRVFVRSRHTVIPRVRRNDGDPGNVVFRAALSHRGSSQWDVPYRRRERHESAALTHYRENAREQSVTYRRSRPDAIYRCLRHRRELSLLGRSHFPPPSDIRSNLSSRSHDASRSIHIMRNDTSRLGVTSGRSYMDFTRNDVYIARDEKSNEKLSWREFDARSTRRLVALSRVSCERTFTSQSRIRYFCPS